MSEHETITAAIKYLDGQGVEVPLDLRLRAYRLTAVKADGLQSINAAYHDTITAALINYFEGVGNISGARNAFRVAMTESFYDAFFLGWTDGGGDTPDKDGLDWLNGRIQQEYGFIEQLLMQAKELKKEKEFDFFAWATERADGYTATVATVYNQGVLFASANKMLTFMGDDGDANHICQSIGGTCVRLKGQRHRASWWISHDMIPYPGNKNYDCGGWRCKHYLADDDGNRVTL